MLDENNKEQVARKLIIYLIAHWPKYIPLTRRWMVHSLFLVDREFGSKVLGLEWTPKWKVPWCPIIMDSLEALGCMNTIRHHISEDYITNLQLPEDIKIAADKFLLAASHLDSLAQAYIFQAKSQRMLMELQDEQ
jgi:hypothetical protein